MSNSFIKSVLVNLIQNSRLTVNIIVTHPGNHIQRRYLRTSKQSNDKGHKITA